MKIMNCIEKQVSKGLDNVIELNKLYDEVQTFCSKINANEISELDLACKTILHEVLSNNALSSKPEYILKLQAILDYVYEKINIGNWKDVELYLRKSTTIASYLKLLGNIKKVEDRTIESILKESFIIIDYGLLFGCPLECEPRLLQNCASILNKTYQPELLDCNVLEPSSEIDQCDTDSNIEIVSCPSLETFYSKYITEEKPVILNDCINHWPALTKWKDQNYLLKLAGLRTVPVEIGTKYTDVDWTQKLMIFEDFIKCHIKNENNTTGYLAQHQLFEQIPELFHDISEPDYCCFNDSKVPTDVNAWYGPKGTITPLHHDPKRNLFAQVVGFKKVFLFSPSDSEYIYPNDEELLSNTARVDPRNVNLELFPKYSKAKVYFCTLKPGQLLYIPPKWWHFIESLSISFSVSFWW